MPNALSTEASPYLRQHADQPVAWRAWSPEAFAEARRRDVPVLVSIGYSTCHWCHVMAHECFDDAAVAELMNRHFVCIKVDREEHPEVDAIYMDTVQALTGRGGWPLNAITDGDGRPFWACTYLPSRQWQQALQDLARLWTSDRQRVLDAASQITAHLQGQAPASGELGAAVWESIATLVTGHFDHDHPSFGAGEMRFPPHQLLVLLLESARPVWHAAAERVLEAMQDAGLHDRVGGGFHRYSTTRDWRVPHFEKMLYDNAQLMVAYARAGVLLDRADFRRTASAIGDYLLREMRVEHAGVFQGYACAEDADDAGGEGSFYAWTPAQLVEVLGEADGTRLAREWDLRAGTAAIGPHGHVDPVTGHIPHPRGAGVPAGEAGQRRRASWEPFLPRLRAVRAPRPRPGRDDKVLTDQNALALEGFAALARMSGESRFIAATRELADVLLRRCEPEGLVRLRYAGRDSGRRPAFIADYGALVAGLMAAFDALGDAALVRATAQVADEAVARLRADDGGFFTTPAGREDLVRRGRECFDNAQPAGQNQLAVGLVRLWNTTGQERWRGLADDLIRASAPTVVQAPHAAATLLQAWNALQRGHATAVVLGDPAAEKTQELLAICRRALVPHLAVVQLAVGAAEVWSCCAGVNATPDAQVQICLGTTCLAPARDAAALADRLGQVAAALTPR